MWKFQDYCFEPKKLVDGLDFFRLASGCKEKPMTTRFASLTDDQLDYAANILRNDEDSAWENDIDGDELAEIQADLAEIRREQAARR